MRTSEFIQAKRDGQKHGAEELAAFVRDTANGEIPDYQVAAWLMAVYFQGLSDHETAVMTEAMADSGDRIDLSGLTHTVDKHSTGGVGDKTTLVLSPLMASLGATVAKVSGRGLGHTGGTIDKLEGIVGFRTEMSDDEFLRLASDAGVVIACQSKDLAPADGTFYALRDATATVESLPLIAASIMSKKLAGGASSILLDVKVGRGTFMTDLQQARALARVMRTLGRRAGREVRVVLSSMEQPLGSTVGHALEVREAIAALEGEGPEDLRTLVTVLAAQLLEATGLDADPERIEAALDDGSARERFGTWIEAQGGDLNAAESLAVAPGEAELTAWRDGVVHDLDAFAVGQSLVPLGGARSRRGDDIDLGVGVRLHAKIGDTVEEGQPLATVVHRDGKGVDEALAELGKAFVIADVTQPHRLVLDVLRAGG